MSLTSRVVTPLLAVVALLASAAPADAAAAPSTGKPQAVVDLTYDVLVAAAVATIDAASPAGPSIEYTPETFSRPTAAPMPASSPVTQAHLKLAPGTTVVVSVFSRTTVNDSVCITGTSTKTSAVVYLSTTTSRPTTVRPYGCALPGHKLHVTKPSKKVLANQRAQVLVSDLRDTAIAEESYATDNNGAFVADTLDRPTKAPLPKEDVLVQQGATLAVGDKVIVTLTDIDSFGGFCITGIRASSKSVLYLTSDSFEPTKHRPAGCVAG